MNQQMQNNRQHNFKLKCAVIAAAFCLPGSALALGLGNIDVKSHLGQPLRATIKIQGVNDIKAADLKGDGCFRLIGDTGLENALTSAHFKLSKIVNDEAILSITTSQIINEPITNMAIMAACEANVRRDYILLLDPAPVVETKNSVDEESTVFADGPPKTNILTEAQTTETQALGAIPQSSVPQSFNAQAHKAQPSSSKKHQSKSSSNKKTNKNVVLTTGFNTDNAITSAAKTSSSTLEAVAKTLTKANVPHLSISSGDMVISNSLESPNLRLDTQLHLSPETSPEAYSPEIAVQDEVTVMNNRLAHLQKQITTLQQRNNNLEAENKLKTQQITQDELSSNHWQWLSYLAGAGLLAGGYFAANWWRRRRQQQQLTAAETLWIDENKAETNIDAINANANDDFFENETHEEVAAVNNILLETSTIPVKNASTESPFSVEEFNEDQNILDHADVFLSHGRTSLAIQLLQNHLLDHPKQSVTIWLFLLELLARENLQPVYEQTILECKEHFNIRIPSFTNDESSEKQGFEDFPRLNSVLQEIWGTPAAQIFLDDLIYNSRLENRIGFEKNVIEELLLLKSIANETLNTAEVIHMDEKKLALKERKEAQLATKKAEKLLQMNELTLLENQNKSLEAETESQESAFEFNLVEYN